MFQKVTKILNSLPSSIKLLVKIRFWWKNISDKTNFVLNFLTLIFSIIGVVVTCIGVYIAWRQLIPQLEQINAKGNIYINFATATSTIQLGPTTSEPLTLTLSAYNKGGYDPIQWRVALMFCKDIQILEADSRWTYYNNSKIFTYESQKLLISQTYLSIYADSLDSIGNFKVIFPTKNNQNLEKKVPLAIVGAAGQKSESTFFLVSLLSHKEKGYIFNYDEIKARDGKISYPNDIDSCYAFKKN